MPIATLTNIEKAFGPRLLLRDANFCIDRGQRVGLIGENGSGKTTLLKIIAGQVEPDAGQVTVAKSLKLGYLAQDPSFNSANCVIDEAELAFQQLHELSHHMRELEQEMADESGRQLRRTLARYQQLQHEFELAGGYAWRHRLEAALHGLGLPRGTWRQNVQTLSGGQRSRLALAKLLIAAPDLLLLDEPTNHLDLDAVEWLEKHLLDFGGAVLLISHGRFLLDRLATRIVWLTEHKLPDFNGNYSAFIGQRAVHELARQRAYEQQQEQIAKTRDFVRRYAAGQRSRQARGRQKRLDRLLSSDAIIRQAPKSRSVRLHISAGQRAGDRVVSVRDLAKSFPGKPLWSGVTFDITRGQRLGMIGPNGSGKTTLLRVLMGQEDADEGSIKWGANLNIGYYDQRLDEFDPEATVLQELRRGRPDIREQELRDMLGALLFSGDDAHKPMGVLSGGERARVALAELLLDRPNVLLLDEPTNHLDIASRQALEGALAQFGGTILCVSHDRYFLEKIVQRLLVLQPPTIIDFPGRYGDWVRKVEQDSARRAVTAEVKSRPASGAKAQAKQNPSNPYLRPFGRLSTVELETEIHQTEIALAECQSGFADAGEMKDADGAKLLHREYKSLSAKLAALEAEYFAREG